MKPTMYEYKQGPDVIVDFYCEETQVLVVNIHRIPERHPPVYTLKKRKHL